LAVDPTVSPRHDLRAADPELARVMFSDALVEVPVPRAGATVVPLEQSSRLARIAARSRSGRGPDGALLPKSRAVQLRDALFEAVAVHVAGDDQLVVYGEENRDWDGAFGVYRGLTELLPYHRLFNAPISEAAIIGTAVGYAMAGGRALVEIMYADFLGRCGDELFNQLAKWQAMSGGCLRMPVTVRVSVGRKYGAQHSQDWSSLVAHVPGLKVAYPATPYDAKGLLATALSGSDPVILFESQHLYDRTEIVHPQVPAEYYRVPFGVPHVAREGRDLTIVAAGPALYEALAAADTLAAEHGFDAAVIDPRTIVPLDPAPIAASVRRTGRLLCVSDAATRGSWLHTLATHVTEEAFAAMRAPAVVLGTPNWITPPAELEEEFFPSAASILDAVHTRLAPLQGYRPTGPARDRTRLMATGR
jgi:2-oxoisovalerate dehydrogenase E1 component